MAEIKIEMNQDAWDDIVKQTVENVCVPMMQAVADACNEQSGLQGGGTEEDPDNPGHIKNKDQSPGYVSDMDGGKPLREHDYRATAITATYPAMADNAANNRLVTNFHAASGVTFKGAE